MLTLSRGGWASIIINETWKLILVSEVDAGDRLWGRGVDLWEGLVVARMGSAACVKGERQTSERGI